MPGPQLVLCFVYGNSHSRLTVDPECVVHKPPMRTAVSADAGTGTSIASDRTAQCRIMGPAHQVESNSNWIRSLPSTCCLSHTCITHRLEKFCINGRHAYKTWQISQL